MANTSVPAATSFPSHQLSNGLYVSGRPDQHKEKAPTMTSSAMPYTGGDVKKSGELGKMFDIGGMSDPSKGSFKKSGPISGTTGGSFRSTAPNPPRSAFSTSGPLNSAGMPRQTSQSSNSGPLTGSGSRSGKTSSSGPIHQYPNPLKTSGPINLPATGLITSTGGAPRKVSGPLGLGESQSAKFGGGGGASMNQAVSNLSHSSSSIRKNFPRAVTWTIISLFVVGFTAGALIYAAVKNSVLLIVSTCLFLPLMLLLLWNKLRGGKNTLLAFAARHPDAQLATAKDGQYVKVTGVVTCGSVPLESPYQKVSRCIYTSASLFEYRSLHSKPANEKHQRFTWGLRHLERHIVDFYISDFQSGLRALVKAGYGACVSPYVEESKIMETEADTVSSSEFMQWLTERNLSRDDRRMRLTEGYIKEGSTVTVMGVVQRNDNVVMIIPPPESVSTGCQWSRCFLPVTLEGIVVTCEEISFKEDVA